MPWSTRSINRIALAITIIAGALAFASSWNDSLIVDEIPHIGAGYSYLVKQDLRLNPEHPPLAKIIAAIPLLFLDLKQSAFDTNFWQKDVNGQWEFGRKLIYENNAELITRVVKIPMILLYALTCFLVFHWTRKKYGGKAGLVALILFAFSPTVMAHGRFVATDLAGAFGVTLATYFLIEYFQHKNKKSFCLAAIAFGIALLTKFSAVLLVPFFVVVVLLFNYKLFLKTISLMIIGFVFIVWPVYAIFGHNYPAARQKADTEYLLSTQKQSVFSEIVAWAADKPIIRHAGHYGLGLLRVQNRLAEGNTVYLNGKVSANAGPIYFPYVYAIKEPIAWLILIIIAIAMTRFKVLGLRFKDEYALLIWIFLYAIVSLTSTVNIGIRHLLPIYPFAIILVSGQVYKIKNWLLYGLLAWYILENVFVFPHYLAYFNQFAGGPSGGYKHVVDSNLDWGQDLKRLAQWVEKNKIDQIQLDYFGWASQYYYLDGNFVWLTSKQRPAPGWFAVSATYLMNNINTDYRWLAGRQPDAVIGHSIFIYKITL